MTAPGFVPRPSVDPTERILAIEKRVRNLQQNVAGATTADSGTLGNATPQPVGTATPGTAVTSSRSDHVHSSTLSAQHDVSITSPTSGQQLAYNGTAWANTSPTLASGTDTNISGPAPGDILVYGSSAKWLNATWGRFLLNGWQDLIRYGEIFSTHRRDQATATTSTPKTVTAVWGIGSQVTVPTQGVRFWLTASVASTITAALYVGTSLSSLAQQGPSVTVNTTTAAGQYQVAWSPAVTVTGSTSAQYVAVQLTQTGTAGTLTWAGLTIGTSGPWLSGGQWYGTTTSTTAPGTTLNASTTNALAASVMPWIALY